MVPFFKFAGRAEHRGREAEQGVRDQELYTKQEQKPRSK